ncbi:hypothetical protein [Butyricimonas paravirosa]|uniref:hypothetical protein n=1 Tax=Butyricimonas paravirosa TaxID=1472417 RepID=UPI0026DEE4BB|nr:hypothetical protein [Butyricimonas paravirosa]
MNLQYVTYNSIKNIITEIEDHQFDTTITKDNFCIEYHCTIQKEYESFENNDRGEWGGLDLAIIIPIVIFFLGFIITEVIRRWNKSNELDQYKQFIDEWVNKSDETLTRYIESLKRFSNEIKVNTDFNIAHWETGMIHLTMINNIPLEKYSDIYIFGLDSKTNNENRENLMDFLYQIEYLDKCPALIMGVYNDYCRQNEKVMDEWNLYYMQLIDLFQMYYNIEPNKFEGQIFHKIMSLFTPLISKVQPDNTVSTDEWYNSFIIPAMHILSNEKCTNYPMLIQLIKLVKGLHISIRKHESINKFHEVFDDYVSSLENAQTTINGCMQYFKNKKIKKFCK